MGTSEFHGPNWLPRDTTSVEWKRKSAVLLTAESFIDFGVALISLSMHSVTSAARQPRVARDLQRVASEDVHDVVVVGLEVNLRPLAEFFEDGPQRLAARCEPIGIVAGCGVGACALHDPRGREKTQPSREDVRRHALRRLKEFGVCARPVSEQVSHDKQRPLITEDV